MGVKKQVDSRIRTLIENGVYNHHRSFFVIVGDHGKEQVRVFRLNLVGVFSVFCNRGSACEVRKCSAFSFVEFWLCLWFA